MIDPSKVHEAHELTDLPRPEVEELTAGATEDVRGGGTPSTTIRADESPKETITFEYGGLQVHYGTQSPSG